MCPKTHSNGIKKKKKKKLVVILLMNTVLSLVWKDIMTMLGSVPDVKESWKMPRQVPARPNLIW